MPKPKFAPLEVPGLPGVAAELEFDGLRYTYQRTVETNLDGNYVPDWTTAKAVKESVQNQLDESLGSETKPYFGILNADTVWLRDAGRGVRFNTILRIGKSGKRDDARMVGQHGEGEVVSTLVAARQGLVKLLASQDWLAVGRLVADPEGEAGDRLLVIDVYQSDLPRVGTAWFWQGPGVAAGLAAALTAFRRHQAMLHTGGLAYNEARRGLAKVGIALPELGQQALVHMQPDGGHLYSRGQEVNDYVSGLLCSYNLTATPGRDRAGFTWEQAAQECEQIWAAHATGEAVANVLDHGVSYGTYCKELAFASAPPAAAIKAGLAQWRRANGKKPCWAWQSADDAPLIADAKERGTIGVMVFSYTPGPPAWVRANIPHVSQYVKANMLAAKTQKPPKAIATVVSGLLVLLGQPDVPVAYEKLTDADGTGDRNGITLDVQRLRGFTCERLLTVLIHETAHYVSGSSDCTRGHTSAISDLSSGLVMLLANSDAHLATLRQLRRQFNAWTKLEED